MFFRKDFKSTAILSQLSFYLSFVFYVWRHLCKCTTMGSVSVTLPMCLLPMLSAILPTHLQPFKCPNVIFMLGHNWIVLQLLETTCHENKGTQYWRLWLQKPTCPEKGKNLTTGTRYKYNWVKKRVGQSFVTYLLYDASTFKVSFFFWDAKRGKFPDICDLWDVGNTK